MYTLYSYMSSPMANRTSYITSCAPYYFCTYSQHSIVARYNLPKDPSLITWFAHSPLWCTNIPLLIVHDQDDGFLNDAKMKQIEGKYIEVKFFDILTFKVFWRPLPPER